MSGEPNGLDFGFTGTYRIHRGTISVVLENGKSYSFQLEGNGDLISRSDQNNGARLEKMQ